MNRKGNDSDKANPDPATFYIPHPPKIYFPLVVKAALMIEPTEPESKEGLDRFIQTMITIAEEQKKTLTYSGTPPRE